MRQHVRQQDPGERIKNFCEVALGLSTESAQTEANRCLQCKTAPCSKKCPVEIDIPAFIKLIKEGKPEEALLKIKEKNNLPAVCGRVCPQEDQCEGACVLNSRKIPINIGALERYASDNAGERLKADGEKKNGLQPSTFNLQPKIAVVGSGPAGLTCAADLAKIGYSVTLFESLHVPGGVLVYGIPEFRLPKKIVANEVEYIRHLGVDVRTDTLIGSTLTVEELFKDGYRAVFVATGAGLPQFMGIPGEHVSRVYSANEFLTRVNLMKAYRFPEYKTPVNVGEKVAVVGGGNVALDCGRCSRRLGKTVTLVYRRTEAEMPGRLEEIKNAKEEGVIFKFLTQPVAISADEKGFVKGMDCIRMELGAPDESGRRRPIPVEDSQFTLDVDTVIVAIGQNPNPLLPRATAGLVLNKNGTIKVDENFMTSIPGVFAGGDIITGADTVIAAMGAGKRAAKEIDAYIKTSV